MSNEHLLRKIIREILKEDLKNVHSKHEKTVAGSALLRRLHDAPGILDSLPKIKGANELAQILQAIIDSTSALSPAIKSALEKVVSHQRKERNQG